MNQSLFSSPLSSVCERLHLSTSACQPVWFLLCLCHDGRLVYLLPSCWGNLAPLWLRSLVFSSFSKKKKKMTSLWNNVIAFTSTGCHPDCSDLSQSTTFRNQTEAIYSLRFSHAWTVSLCLDWDLTYRVDSICVSAHSVLWWGGSTQNQMFPLYQITHVRVMDARGEAASNSSPSLPLYSVWTWRKN